MNTRSFLGKCKSCKRHVQVSCTAAERRSAWRNAKGKVIIPERVAWEVVDGVHAGFRSPLEPAWNGKWQVAIACPHCSASMTVQAVSGTYSAAHECGARCLASTGPNCECSCGGANHGKSHAA